MFLVFFVFLTLVVLRYGTRSATGPLTPAGP